MNPLFSIQAYFNRFFFAARSALRIGRKNYVEKPAGRLSGLSTIQENRIRILQKTYGVSFEKKQDLGNALENYHLLDLLDRFPGSDCWPLLKNLQVLDVGSKNFYYASALYHFFQPETLKGLEVDAYRIYRDGHTRLSYAQFYTSDLPGVTYEVGDFTKLDGLNPDVVLFFFPFVIPEPLVYWGLPLHLFKPEVFFQQAFRILKPNGFLFMVNQGEEEYAAAQLLAQKAGFVCRGFRDHHDGLLLRTVPPQASLWQKV